MAAAFAKAFHCKVNWPRDSKTAPSGRMVLFRISGRLGYIHGTYNAKRIGTVGTGDDAAGQGPP